MGDSHVAVSNSELAIRGRSQFDSLGGVDCVPAYLKHFQRKVLLLFCFCSCLFVFVLFVLSVFKPILFTRF